MRDRPRFPWELIKICARLNRRLIAGIIGQAQDISSINIRYFRATGGIRSVVKVENVRERRENKKVNGKDSEDIDAPERGLRAPARDLRSSFDSGQSV